jgi:hypothetical protein
VGEKRFLSSFTLLPPFLTAFAALAALALASSAESTRGAMGAGASSVKEADGTMGDA